MIIQHRYSFVKQRVAGRVLNIGCGNDPLELEKQLPGNVIQFDFDAWTHKNSVQGDAHSLPFRDKCFDVVVMADVLEHILYPTQALVEAKRVSDRLLASIFQEWSLGHGQHVEEAQENHRVKTGFPDATDMLDEYRLTGDVVRSTPEAVYPHLLHINQFEWADLAEIIKRAGWQIVEQGVSVDGNHEGHALSSWLVEAVA